MRCSITRQRVALPDGSARAQFEIGHTGRVLQPGERLRLQVCSSDYPLYVPHPGTDESPWFATAVRTNRQTLQVGGADPSRLTLTVLAP